VKKLSSHNNNCHIQWELTCHRECTLTEQLSHHLIIYLTVYDVEWLNMLFWCYFIMFLTTCAAESLIILGKTKAENNFIIKTSPPKLNTSSSNDNEGEDKLSSLLLTSAPESNNNSTTSTTDTLGGCKKYEKCVGTIKTKMIITKQCKKWNEINKLYERAFCTTLQHRKAIALRLLHVVQMRVKYNH